MILAMTAVSIIGAGLMIYLGWKVWKAVSFHELAVYGLYGYGAILLWGGLIGLLWIFAQV